MWLEERVLLSAARQTLRSAPLVLPASVMNSAVPIAIGSTVSGNLSQGEPISTRSSRVRTVV